MNSFNIEVLEGGVSHVSVLGTGAKTVNEKKSLSLFSLHFPRETNQVSINR